jgi:hypothetical protein
VELERGLDLRLPQYRREVFLRFYLHALRHRSHPGGVYYLIPWLTQRFNWDMEHRLWFAFLNGNTQNPLTSLILMQVCDDAGDSPAVEEMLRFFDREWRRLPFDTDRRHQKGEFPRAVREYRATVEAAGGQAAFWNSAADLGFSEVWARARGLHGFGRLSAFSYAEYLRICGIPFECEELFLSDIPGSRSHRNGLALIAGREDLVWDKQIGSNTTGRYTRSDIALLGDLAYSLVSEAQEETRAAYDRPEREAYWPDYFTLESALCTYKSWHKPNRRYPNVYNDMLYSRITQAQRLWPRDDVVRFLTDLMWRARRDSLPGYLRLEDNPTDPGLSPPKQNHYLHTGQTVMLGHEDPALWGDFDTAVAAGDFGLRPDTARTDRMVLR